MRMISTPGALVACSLSFLCSACGDDAGPSGVPRDRAHNTPAGAGGAAPEGDERTSTIDFDVAVPGADQPVTARVGAHGGAVEVLSYPSDVTLPLSYGSLPLGYEDAFSDAFCDSVRQQATGNDAERLLRHQGAVTALVALSPLVAPALNVSLIHAAADATGGLSAAVTNPLLLTSSEVSLTLGPDAISRTLGDDTALLAPFSTALARQASTAYLAGSYQVSLAARDLWCDLARGNAQIQIDLTGTFGAEGVFAGRTVVRGVERL